MKIDLSNKVAIVTGAGSYHGDDALRLPGQGSSSAEVMAACGAAVVLADINGAAAEKRAEAIRDAGGDAVAVETDISDEASVRNMVATAVREFDRLDILHNNAAALQALFDPGDPEITSLEVSQFEFLSKNLLLGPMLCCKHSIPEMVRTGGGSIISMASISGMMGELNLTIYGCMKAGIIQMTRAISTQWGKEGIRANAIAPGLILSPPSLAIGEELIAEYARHCDTVSVGQPLQTANVAAFLASDLASFVTGQVIPVDGGQLQQSSLAADSRATGLVAGGAGDGTLEP